MSLATGDSSTPPHQADSTEATEDLSHLNRAQDVLGFDPRRFFDQPLETRVRGALNPVERMAALIRGIDHKRKLASLMTVEQSLDRTPPDGRDTVMGMLEERMAYLDSHGERPDPSTPLSERPQRFQHVQRSVPPKRVWIVERTSEGKITDRTLYHEHRNTSASAKLQNITNGGDET